MISWQRIVLDGANRALIPLKILNVFIMPDQGINIPVGTGYFGTIMVYEGAGAIPLLICCDHGIGSSYTRKYTSSALI